MVSERKADKGGVKEYYKGYTAAFYITTKIKIYLICLPFDECHPLLIAIMVESLYRPHDE